MEDEMADTPRFWMVVGIGQGAPTVRHGTHDAASKEAKRLARANAGVTFVVLQAVSAITKREFDIVDLGSPNAPYCEAPDACTRPRCDCDIPF